MNVQRTYTISKNMKNNVTGESLLEYTKQRFVAVLDIMGFKKIVESNQLTDIISVPNKHEFEKEALPVSLLGTFYKRQLYYTYEEFMEHLDATKKFEEQNENYKIVYKNKHRRNKKILFCYIDIYTALCFKRLSH